MVAARLIVISLALAWAGRASAQARLSAEQPTLDLATAMRFVWPHATGDREVEVRIDRDRGPCVLRVARRAIEEFDVSGVYFDEEQHTAGSCYGRARLVDDGDLVIEIGTAFADAGEPGLSSVRLLSRDARGAAFVSTSGSREREIRWYEGHGASDAIARAVASCTRAVDPSRAWERLEMLRATVSERGECAERWVAFVIGRAAECEAQEGGDRMFCYWVHADRLGGLLRPVLAEHEVRVRSAIRAASMEAERAAHRAIDALPLVSAEDPVAWRRLAEPLTVYTDENFPLLPYLGLQVEWDWLERDLGAAHALARCLEARDRATMQSSLRALERETRAPRALAERCREHLGAP